MPSVADLPPVVYAGPTIEPDEVRTHLPGAQVMPPVRRGDLYRDRLLGFGVFVILDGVFFQRLAVSPREVVDVLQDGGTVVGAASMGAIRAAECWPAGIRGVGSIYRLYRRGALASDDEVAVAFEPFPPYAPVTVPLINVRYAVARALRLRQVAAAAAGRIIATAERLHFTERRWPAIMKAAGQADLAATLQSCASTWDVKRRDAIRALRRVRRWRDEHPHWFAPRARGAAIVGLRRGAREAAHEADAGQLRPDRRALWQWLIGSGELGDSDVATALGRDGVEPETLIPDESLAGREVWASVWGRPDMERLVMHFAAVQAGCQLARAKSLRPTADDWGAARLTVATNHGFSTWSDLCVAFENRTVRKAWAEHACEQLALARSARHERISWLDVGA